MGPTQPPDSAPKPLPPPPRMVEQMPTPVAVVAGKAGPDGEAGHSATTLADLQKAMHTPGATEHKDVSQCHFLVSVPSYPHIAASTPTPMGLITRRPVRQGHGVNDCTGSSCALMSNSGLASAAIMLVLVAAAECAAQMC